MIRYMIPLVSVWIPIWSNYLVYFFALAFIAFVPAFILSIFRS